MNQTTIILEEIRVIKKISEVPVSNVNPIFFKNAYTINNVWSEDLKVYKDILSIEEIFDAKKSEISNNKRAFETNNEQLDNKRLKVSEKKIANEEDDETDSEELVNVTNENLPKKQGASFKNREEQIKKLSMSALFQLKEYVVSKELPVLQIPLTREEKEIFLDLRNIAKIFLKRNPNVSCEWYYKHNIEPHVPTINVDQIPNTNNIKLSNKEYKNKKLIKVIQSFQKSTLERFDHVYSKKFSSNYFPEEKDRKALIKIRNALRASAKNNNSTIEIYAKHRGIDVIVKKELEKFNPSNK